MKILLLIFAVLFVVGLFVKKSSKTDSGDSIMSCETSSESSEVFLPSHPIPFGEGEESVIWTGKMNVEFTYQEKGQKKQRHKMELQRVVVRETRRLFLEGVDLETGEEVSFRRWFITTSIKPAGKRWLHDTDFFAMLGINVEQYDCRELYYDAEEKWRKNQWKAALKTLWRSEQPIEIEFTYLSSYGRERRTVELSLVQQNEDNEQCYFTGICKDKGEERTFNTRKIDTKIVYDGKKYSIEEFITDQLGVELLAA